MDLEKELTDQLSKELAAEIDAGVLAGIYVGLGWTEIVVDPWIHSSSKEINKWCENTFVKKWIKVGNRWIIESEKEAAWFALKWGT